jgi:hypothetical protein
MSGLFGRSDPPIPPQLPAPPKPQEILDVIDEVTGTQAITVTGPDGKKKRVVSRLPRTPQEEQFFRQGEELITGALQNLKTLYQQQPEQLTNYQPLVDTFANINEQRARDLGEVANIGNIEQEVQGFKDIQKNLMDEEMRKINRAQEEGLIQRGHYNSTAGDSLRAMLAREEGLARQQADLQARSYGENLAGQKLNRNVAAYGLREEGRRGQLEQAERDFALAEHQRQQLEGQRSDSIQSNINQLQVGSNLTGQDLSRAMATQAPQLGLQQFALANQNQLNHYNANVGRLNQNFQNQMAHHNARPPSFGETVGRLGMMGAGMFLGGPMGAQLGSSGNDMLFGNNQQNTRRS